MHYKKPVQRTSDNPQKQTNETRRNVSVTRDEPIPFSKVISYSQLGMQIGKAMSVNVIERVILRALNAANLGDCSSAIDRWANGTAIKELQSTCGRKDEPGMELYSRFRKADPQPAKRVTGDLPTVYATLMPFRQRNKRYFILDSGASFHLVDEATLSPGEKNNIRSL